MTQPLAAPSEQSAPAHLAREFPFECELSLRPLISYWEKKIAPEDSLRGRVGRMIQAEVRRAPELSAPVQDLGILA
jgi:hypothetical protein